VPTLEIDDLLSSLTPQQKRAMLEALVRDFLPEIRPTDSELAADAKELADRNARREQALGIDELLMNDAGNDSSPKP
jgi:hypothetical protein